MASPVIHSLSEAGWLTQPGAPGAAGPELLETTRELRTPQGTAQLHQWAVEGLQLAHVRWRLTAPASFAWHPAPDTVQLHLSLRGRAELTLPGLPAPLRLHAYEHNLLYAAAQPGHLHYPELDAETVVLQLPRPQFLALTPAADPLLTAFRAHLAAGTPAVLSARSRPLTLPLHTLLHDVQTCALPAPLRGLYLQAKARELLALHLAAFTAPDPTPDLREYDRERLQFARDYLTAHTHLPPSLPELARLAGLNECKLKQGFKALFGLPVFAYLAEWRLQEAHLRLRQGPQSASEVAFELGYSSLQHFSNSFKKRFGVSPRELKGG